MIYLIFTFTTFFINGFSFVETGGEGGNSALARVMIVCVLQLDICTTFYIIFPTNTHANMHTQVHQ